MFEQRLYRRRSRLLQKFTKFFFTVPYTALRYLIVAITAEE